MDDSALLLFSNDDASILFFIGLINKSREIKIPISEIEKKKVFVFMKWKFVQNYFR